MNLTLIECLVLTINSKLVYIVVMSQSSLRLGCGSLLGRLFQQSLRVLERPVAGRCAQKPEGAFDGMPSFISTEIKSPLVVRVGLFIFDHIQCGLPYCTLSHVSSFYHDVATNRKIHAMKSKPLFLQEHPLP